MVPLVLCHSSQKGIYILHHGRGIFAAQHILAAILKLNKKTVARTAVIGKILAKVTFLEPAPISQESAAAANAYRTHSWRAQLHRLNVSHMQHLGFKASLYTNCIFVHRNTHRHPEQRTQKHQKHHSCQRKSHLHRRIVHKHKSHQYNNTQRGCNNTVFA